MKRILFLLILSLISFELQADAGYAFRYKATISLKDKSDVTGYFFFTTYQNRFNPKESDFKNYIFTNYHFPISLYENIKTIRVNDYLTVDFVIKGSEKTIEKNEIESIELIEDIETKVGSRLRLLSEQEYKLLNQNFLNTERINYESYVVHCSYYLLNWNASNDLKELKESIYKKIEELTQENNSQGVLDYINKMKMDLIYRDIILFQYCSAN